MTRHYYLAIRTIKPFLIMESLPLANLIFAESDVKEHIADKLHTVRTRYGNKTHPFVLFDLYESLDTDHQIMFDTWFQKEMDKVEANTIPYF